MYLHVCVAFDHPSLRRVGVEDVEPTLGRSVKGNRCGSHRPLLDQAFRWTPKTWVPTALHVPDRVGAEKLIQVPHLEVREGDAVRKAVPWRSPSST